MNKARTMCASRGCRNVATRSGYCAEHAATRDAAVSDARRRYEAEHASDIDRRIRTTADWRAKSREVMMRNPHCQDPLGVHAALHEQSPRATSVHHRCKLSERPDLALWDANLVAVCERCHAAMDNQASERVPNE